MLEKKAIIVVSFGTTQKDSRDAAIGGIEKAVQAAFPEQFVQRSFTSSMVIRIIEKKEGLQIDSPAQALERAFSQGCRDIVVQPTHVMPGQEYEKLMHAVEEFHGRFSSIYVGAPLLSSEDDVRRVISTVRRVTSSYDDGQTAVVLVGHGTEHEANRIYAQMQSTFQAYGHANYLVGTIEASPSMTDVRQICAERGYSRVVLVPMMVVAGDHAIHDIAGDAEDSWKSTLAGDGYEVIVLKRGLGEYEEVQQIYVDHIRAAVH